MKKSTNYVIDEEKQSKNIEILLTYPIHLYLGNATFLTRQKKKIEEIVRQVTGVLN